MKKLILTLFIPLLFISCGDNFTDLVPLTQRNVNTFYKNQTDFQLAIRGALDGLQSRETFGVNFVLFMEMRADNGANGGGATGLAASLEQLDTFTDLADGDEVAATYDKVYNVIASTNNILARIDAVEFESDDNDIVKDQIKGEAYFIRSLLYYHMAVIFGNVPLQLEEVTNPDVQVNQVGESVIYDQIATDLAAAENLLPETGRITKWAAAALLGRVQLANGNDLDAVGPLRRVIGSLQYDLVPNYANIWGASNEGNIESIFEIQFASGNVGEGSSYTDNYTPLGFGNVGGGGAPQNVTEDVIGIYEAGDERFAATIDTTDRPNAWVRKFISSPTVSSDGDNNWMELRYAEVLLNLAEALGEGGEAYDLIDQVRGRANLGPIDRTAVGGTFDEKLLHERRVEFAFENKRWADLKRFGVAKSTMAIHLGGATTESDITLLFPIPQGVIDVSPEDMTQNAEH